MKISFLLLMVLILYSCKKDIDKKDYTSQTIQYKTISSVNSNLLSLDVYYKDKSNLKPVVIYVHGGGWAIGDKTNSLNNKVSLFNSLDYTFVSLNYRLSPFPYKPNDTDRVKYPVHNNDVADAIKWVSDNIGNYGGDKNKIVLFGHSAGAQIVSLIATDKSFLEEKGLALNVIKGVGIIDTKGFDVLNIVHNTSSTQNMYINGFGTDSLQNIKASPIRILNSNQYYPKMFITIRGDSNRKASINAFITIAKTFNIEFTVVDGEVYSHSKINDAIGKENEIIITEPFKDFLSDCFE